MHMFFRKRPGCAIIGACALIRTNTVINKQTIRLKSRGVHYKFINELNVV